MATKTIRELVLKSYDELEEDKTYIKSSMDVLDSRIKDIDYKIECLNREILALQLERVQCVNDRAEYQDIFKADVITRLALKDFMKNRFNEII